MTKNTKMNSVLNHVFKYINLYNKTYYDDKKHIHYLPTNNYNYDGPNLQEGDKFGVCFLFPFLLFVNSNDTFTSFISSKEFIN